MTRIREEDELSILIYSNIVIQFIYTIFNIIVEKLALLYGQFVQIFTYPGHVMLRVYSVSRVLASGQTGGRRVGITSKPRSYSNSAGYHNVKIYVLEYVCARTWKGVQINPCLILTIDFRPSRPNQSYKPRTTIITQAGTELNSSLRSCAQIFQKYRFLPVMPYPDRPVSFSIGNPNRILSYNSIEIRQILH